MNTKTPKENKERKPYVAPDVIDEIELETRAGSVWKPKSLDTVVDT